jgi:hypothetical protein
MSTICLGMSLGLPHMEIDGISLEHLEDNSRF